MKKQHLITCLKAVVSIGLMAYVCSLVDFPTLWDLLKRMDMTHVVMGVFSFTALLVLGAVRWHVLLKAHDLEFSLWQAFRLHMVGLFFNTVMPGLTGGDAVKAVMVAKETDEKTKAVMTVFVDRVVGLMCLVLTGSAALLFYGDDPQFAQAGQIMFAITGTMLVGAVFFFSHTLRRLTRWETLVKKLPLGDILVKADQAVLHYRDHKLSIVIAMALSVIIHLSGTYGNYQFGLAMGLDTAYLAYVATLPTIFIISALPISIGGWGVGEKLYITFLGYIGVAKEPALTISLLTRTAMMLWGLCGGVFLFNPRIRAAAKEGKAAETL